MDFLNGLIYYDFFFQIYFYSFISMDILINFLNIVTKSHINHEFGSYFLYKTFFTYLINIS